MNGLRKMWYIHIMEYYSVIKKNEIMLFAGKWMEPENIILSKVSQAQRSKVTCGSPRPVRLMYL
jgi:hypothetical protein